MPTYQYACTACGEQLEAVQSFTDAALTECPQCSGALRKVYSAVGVVFKGSGFYKNDSRPARKSEGGAKTDGGDGGGGSGDGAAKTDTKTPAPGKSEPAGKSEKASKGDAARKSSTPTPAATSA